MQSSACFTTKLGHSCARCYRSKTGCDGARPCARCVRTRHECLDRPNMPGATTTTIAVAPTPVASTTANTAIATANANTALAPAAIPPTVTPTIAAPIMQPTAIPSSDIINPQPSLFLQPQAQPPQFTTYPPPPPPSSTSYWLGSAPQTPLVQPSNPHAGPAPGPFPTPSSGAMPPRANGFDNGSLYLPPYHDGPMTPLSEQMDPQQQQAFTANFLRGPGEFVDDWAAGGVSASRPASVIASRSQAGASLPPPSSTKSSRRIRGADIAELGNSIVQNHAELNSLRTFRRQLDRREVGARRLKYYFSTLSELLTAEQFTHFTSELQVQIPLSCRSPYSLLEAAAAASAHRKKKELLSACEDDSAKKEASPEALSVTTPNSPTLPPLSFFYVDFTWRWSPTVCLSDTESAGLASPIALMRLERLSPFLEEAHVFKARKQASAKQFGLASKQPASSSRRKRSRSRTRRKAHRLDAASQLVQQNLSPSNTTASAPSNDSPAIESRDLHDSISRRLDRRSSRSARHHRHHHRRRRKPNPADSHTNSNNTDVEIEQKKDAISEHSSFESDDSIVTSDFSCGSEEDEQDTNDHIVEGSSGPLSYPPLSKYHEPSCVYFDPLFVSAESSGRDLPAPGGAVPASATPCACPPMQPIAMCLHVNAEWERLFGVTQSELRTLAMREGHRAMNKFTRADSVEESFRARAEGFLEARADYKYMAVVINKWGAEINCLVRCHLRYDDGGCLLESVHTWLPMPDTTAPPIKRNEPN